MYNNINYGSFIRESLRELGLVPKLVMTSDEKVSFAIDGLGRFTIEKWYIESCMVRNEHQMFSVFMAGAISERQERLESLAKAQSTQRVSIFVPIDPATKELIHSRTRLSPDDGGVTRRNGMTHFDSVFSKKTGNEKVRQIKITGF